MVVTDHKPLEAILNNLRHTTSIHHVNKATEMFVQMLDYEFGVEDRPGTTNITQ